jgi:hypothetical protein
VAARLKAIRVEKNRKVYNEGWLIYETERRGDIEEIEMFQW